MTTHGTRPGAGLSANQGDSDGVIVIGMGRPPGGPTPVLDVVFIYRYSKR